MKDNSIHSSNDKEFGLDDSNVKIIVGSNDSESNEAHMISESNFDNQRLNSVSNHKTNSLIVGNDKNSEDKILNDQTSSTFENLEGKSNEPQGDASMFVNSSQNANEADTRDGIVEQIIPKKSPSEKVSCGICRFL